jgi:hypothetical protein
MNVKLYTNKPPVFAGVKDLLHPALDPVFTGTCSDIKSIFLGARISGS